MVYQNQTEKKDLYGTKCNPKEMHSWRPPCSCGIELGEALKVEESVSEVSENGEVHSWRPPCSCGVSLDEVVD